MRKEFRYFLFLNLLICYSVVAQAQNSSPDKLLMNDGEIMNCKVISVDDESIEIDPEGPVQKQIINKSEVNSIIYADGTIVNLAISNQSSDFTPKDSNGRTLGLVNLRTNTNIKVKRDSKGLQKNESKYVFYYKENGKQKSAEVKVTSSWRDWWAHEFPKSALAFSEFIVGIQIYDKGTGEILGAKDYSLTEYKYMEVGTPKEEARTWASKPLPCENWNFTIFLNTKITKWGLPSFASSVVITYDYEIDLKIETK